MKTLNTLIIIAYVVVNVIALVQVIGSYRWPGVTRVVFFFIFALAAVVNTGTVLDSPWVYQSYEEYAIPLYGRFILGPFDTIIQPMVLSIVVGQVFIAASMFMNRHWFRAGCIGGILFCLSIAPLGMGAGFPCTLLLAFAFYQLFRHEGRKTVRGVFDKNRISLPATY
ncbi:hypothetical protein [Spirosoma areae]